MTQSPVGADALARLQAYADDRVDRFGNIGVLIGIDTPWGRHFVTSGATRKDAAGQPSCEHWYQIGSQTKMVTAFAGHLLLKDGVLTLNEPVGSALGIDIDDRITVEHLFMNTSGLGEFTRTYLGPSYPGAIKLTPEDLVRLAQTQGQFFDPGSRFDYSNINFVLLGLLVERRTGQTLADFLRRRLVRPLALDMVFLSSEPPPPEPRLHGYLTTTRIRPEVDTVEGAEAACFFGTGDIAAKAGAMLDFGRLLLDRTNSTGVSLADFSTRTARADYRPLLMGHSVGGEYGLGMEVACWAGRPVWGHRGTTFGYQSSTWIDPQDASVVTTCVTTVHDLAEPPGFAEARYAPQQLFCMALSAAHLLSAFPGEETPPR